MEETYLMVSRQDESKSKEEFQLTVILKEPDDRSIDYAALSELQLYNLEPSGEHEVTFDLDIDLFQMEPESS